MTGIYIYNDLKSKHNITMIYIFYSSSSCIFLNFVNFKIISHNCGLSCFGILCTKASFLQFKTTDLSGTHQKKHIQTDNEFF